ncbi:MAG TPA: flagellar motor stator protein MotA [Alphaproteobacteria bacterium]|jgi:chemotaxis protein MotA|nr:flagellar motor stator protein MotA [Alphaproteobacteria bacterium]
MLKIIGHIGVVIATLGGYAAMGGKLAVLNQPYELVIILGTGVMAFLVANSTHVLKSCLKDFKAIYRKDKYGKQEYLELLSMLYVVFRTARSKGWLALEQHIENPHDSEIFKKFPSFHNDHHAVTFLCDYLRLISLGAEKPHEVEALMDQEIDTQREERNHTSHAMQTMADGLPALGIVAAVLGVIKTMGAISEPPEVLGRLIGGALVGTFLGVWLAYGFVGPIASAMKERNDTELKYYLCIKTSILAFLQGAAPQVAIEFGRKILMHDVQPTFLEVEEATQNVSTS